MADYYSVRVGSRELPSRISIEPLIWLWLREIAAEQRKPLSQLMDEINKRYRLQTSVDGKHRVITLSSAVRIFVTEHIASCAVSARHNTPSRSKPKRQAQGKAL
jgi:predicted DNA-binding ribbon-helix-helix protein